MAAAEGRSFGSVAEIYERGRPEWPAALLDAVPVPARSDVLDLAAGTGKLTRLLAIRHRVVAVEPDDAMRSLIRPSNTVSLGEVAVLAGTAEAIPLAEASVDAVFVGEAFHWFDGDRALSEIARVLRDRGALVVAFNTWDDITPPLPAAARALLRSIDERFGPPGGPKVASGEWRHAFAGSAFEDLRHERIEHTNLLERERVVALFASMSNVARQPDDARSAFGDELRAAVPAGTRTLHLTCELYWTRLEPR